MKWSFRNSFEKIVFVMIPIFLVLMFYFLYGVSTYLIENIGKQSNNEEYRCIKKVYVDSNRKEVYQYQCVTDTGEIREILPKTKVTENDF